MIHTEIDSVLSCLERLGSHKYVAAMVYEIETFELKLRFFRTALMLQHFGLADSLDFVLSICSHMEIYLDTFVRLNESLQGVIEQDMALALSRVRHSIATSVNSQPSVKNSTQLSRETQPGISMHKEFLLEFLDSLLENLSGILHWLSDKKSISSFVEQVETLTKKLKVLRDLYRFKASIEHQKLEYLSGQLSSLAHRIACLWQTFWTATECFTLNAEQPLVPHSMNHQLSYLIFKIKLIEPMVQKIYFKAVMASKASLSETSKRNVPPPLPFFVDAILECLKELRCSSSNLIVPFSNLILNIHKKLEFLKSFYMDPPESYVEQEKLKDISTGIEALTMEAAFFCHRFDPDTLSEGLASGLNSDLCRLFEKFQIVNEEIEEIYHEIPKSPRSLFPRTLGLGFIDHFLHYLNGLLIISDDSVVLVKHEVETMKSDLVLLYSFLSNFGKKLIEDKLSQEIFTHIIQVAFEAEYVIDSIISRERRLWYLMLHLLDVIEEIKIIKEQVKKIDREVSDTIILKVGKSISCATSLLSNPTIDEVMVGFEDETERIINQLTRGSKELDIIPIVGMPGQGKTTLAKKVYNEDIILRHFDVHAWCCVSQEYNKDKLLYGIFRQIVGHGDIPLEDDIADKLRKVLIGKRFIIVLDDVWKIALLDDLVRSFPSGNNGSRILLTTRLDEVADNPKYYSDPHHLRLFTQEESLDLLRRKLFQNTNFPPELYSAGREIAKKCHGLPLAVVLVAGVLSRTDNRADSWHEFTKNSISHIVSGEKHCTDIIEFSYVHLPDHLKPCFLYFGAFPEDTQISVSKIIQLWIAEGFIQQTEGMSSEVMAQNYLEDLISSSLLIVSERRSNGGIKTCCVHDLLLDFCLNKAKELHLLQLVKRCNSSNLELSRASVHLEQDDLYRRMPVCQGLRSLLYFTPGKPDSWPSSMALDVSYIINTFRLLRVLDLGSTYIGQDFPPGIELLIHLRYLAIVVDLNALPPSLGNLRSLESLHVIPVGQNYGAVELPSTFWNMLKLRHVRINDCIIYGLRNYEQTFSRNPSKLDNLITLSCAYLLFREETDDLLRMFPNLQKLRCIFSGWLCSSGSSSQIPRLDLLTRLECLNASFDNSVELPYPYELKFPCSLKKLTLKGFQLPWSEISIITELPCLEILKLVFNAFVGEVWDMGDNIFLKLKFLELSLLNIIQWNAFDTSFPILERLVISSCYKLEKIPSSFVDMPMLEIIEVKWCKDSLASSALQLKDEQLEYTGCDNLKVHLHHIYPPDEDDALPC